MRFETCSQCNGRGYVKYYSPEADQWLEKDCRDCGGAGQVEVEEFYDKDEDND